MDFFEDISVIQVVDGSVKLKANEMLGLKALHALEDFSLVNLVVEDYFKMALDGQQKIRDMDIAELVLPNFDLKRFLSIAIQIPPNSKGSLSVPENDVQEADNPVCFPFLLSLFFHIILHYFLGEVLKVEPKVVLHSPGNNVSFDDVLQPILFYLLVNEADMSHIQATNMDEFSELS